MALRAFMLVLAVALTACRDSGLPDRNLPLMDARNREYSYEAYQPAPNAMPVALAGSNWMRSLPMVTIPPRLLAPVGNADGTVLYALRGRSAPYDRLYSPAGDDRWRPFLPLH